jgi:hypothetical protein
MKVNYPTDKKYAQKDFTNNFRNIKKSSKSTISKKLRKTVWFVFAVLRKSADVQKISKMSSIKHR